MKRRMREDRDTTRKGCLLQGNLFKFIEKSIRMQRNNIFPSCTGKLQIWTFKPDDYEIKLKRVWSLHGYFNSYGEISLYCPTARKDFTRYLWHLKMFKFYCTFRSYCSDLKEECIYFNIFIYNCIYVVLWNCHPNYQSHIQSLCVASRLKFDLDDKLI